METKAFFESLVGEYDDFILKVVPCYADLFWAMFYYLPDGMNPKHVVDLGCGTGNVTQAIHKTFPEARITCVDEVAAMLNATAKKVDPEYLNFVESNFVDLRLPEERFGLVMSNLAVHHLPDEDKKRLVKYVYDWLEPGGVFVLSDGFRSASPALYQKDLTLWDELVVGEGRLPQEEWDEGVRHREAHDIYATLDDFKDWLSEAGFAQSECVWRYGVWGVIHAQKPPLS